MGASPPDESGADSGPPPKCIRLHSEPDASALQQNQFPFDKMPGMKLRVESKQFPVRPGVVRPSGPPNFSHFAAAKAAARDFLIEQEAGLVGHNMEREFDKTVTLNAVLSIAGGLGNKEQLRFTHRMAAEQATQPSPSKAELAGPVNHDDQQAAGTTKPPADSPTHNTGDRSSVDGFRGKLQEQMKNRDVTRKADAVGELQDHKNDDVFFYNFTAEIKYMFKDNEQAEYHDSMEQGAEQAVLALIANACDSGSKRSVHFVVTDFDLIVSGAARLTPECVNILKTHYYGRALQVPFEDLQGTFELVYATRHASILKPVATCSSTEAVLELLAAALPQCRHWTPQQWYQRRLGAHRSILQRLLDTLASQELLPEGCSRDYFAKQLRLGDIGEVYKALYSMDQPEAAKGAITAKHIPELDADVAQLVNEQLQGESPGVADEAKAALRQAGAYSLERIAYLKEAYLAPLHKFLTPCDVDMLIEKLRAAAQKWRTSQQQQQQQQQQKIEDA